MFSNPWQVLGSPAMGRSFHLKGCCHLCNFVLFSENSFCRNLKTNGKVYILRKEISQGIYLKFWEIAKNWFFFFFCANLNTCVQGIMFSHFFVKFLIFENFVIFPIKTGILDKKWFFRFFLAKIFKTKKLIKQWGPVYIKWPLEVRFTPKTAQFSLIPHLMTPFFEWNPPPGPKMGFKLTTAIRMM